MKIAAYLLIAAGWVIFGFSHDSSQHALFGLGMVVLGLEFRVLAKDVE